MAVNSYVVIVLLQLFFSYGAAEYYYVTPTEPTSASCPAQPCLTLSQYASDSDHYFKSNTVFKLLAGTHHMTWTVQLLYEMYTTCSLIPS